MTKPSPQTVACPEPHSDKPTEGVLDNFADALHVVCHPAFRLGFLDAQSGRPHDHFSIIDRIYRETPRNALLRLGWGEPDWFMAGRAAAAEMAEYRYEEGRLLHLDIGLHCKAWGHPDYPPREVMDYLIDRFARPEMPTADEIAERKEKRRRRAVEMRAVREADLAERARQGALSL